MYLRISSVAHVRAGHDELRLYYLRGPILRSLRSGTGQARPLLERGPSIVLRAVEHDAFCGRTSAGCGTYISFKYG